MAQETWIQSHVASYLDTSLLNTQQYQICIEGKEKQSWERSSAFLYYSVL